MKNINLNLGQLYVLSAPPASGKSTLLSNNNIPDSMVVSADTLRSRIYGDVPSYDEDGVYNNPLHNDEAGVHRILRENIRMRLKEKLTTFVDVTAVTDKDRKNYVKLAEEFGVECKILILDVEQETCLKQDKLRVNRVGKDVIERFFNKFQRESKFPFEVINSDSNLVFIPNTLPHNRFDIIGDTHGCLNEFIEFATTKLGYQFDKKTGNLFHIEGRNLLFLGDFVDRGSQSIEMLQFVQNLQKFGHKAIVGNHENKLINFYKTLNKENRIHVASRAAAQTAMEFSKLPKQKRDGLYNFLVSLPHYYVKDNFAFTHAGVQSFSPESIPRSFAIYGDLRGRNDTTDTDEVYESLFKAGVNEYYLIRGHNELTNEEQSIVLSLDNNVAFTGGSMQALNLDRAMKLKNEDKYANLSPLILSQNVDYNYEEVLEEQFKINSLMQTLKKNKLASCKTDEIGRAHV